MFSFLGRLATTRSRLILIIAALAVVGAGALGIHAVSKLKGAGFVSPSAPSQIAENRLTANFGGSPNLVFLVQAQNGNVDDPAVASAGEAVATRLAETPGVNEVTSYWATHNPALRSGSGTEALVVANVEGSDSTVSSRTKSLVKELSVTNDTVRIQAGGTAAANNAIGTQITKDLAIAESIAIPITMVLLILAFGSVVAAALPLVIGLLAIMATLAILFLLGSITNVSQYALNLTTAMGLGLGIDYSLLIVNRYREGLAAGMSVSDAVQKAISTSGRTVVFSAAAVTAAMAVLLVFPVYFLRSFAYAGISVIAVAAIAAVLVLPSVLFVLGTKVNALPVPIPGRQRRFGQAESPFWRWTASTVMRHPVGAGLPVLIVLVALAFPFLHVRYGTPDDRVLPTTAAARQVGDALRTNFGSNTTDTADVATSRPLDASESAAYLTSLEAVAGVRGVQVRQGETTTWFSAVLAPDPESGAAKTVVQDIRQLPVAPGVRTWVGGSAASLLDQKQDLASRLPLALLLIALTTFIILWLFTGSVVLPLKALAMNVLSLSAVFGAMVWIFQYGHLSSVIGFTPQPTSTTMPLLLFCIAFGLSMDYEVFMLSRIKELHDAGVSNEEAVAGGLARTGRIITTAAALLAVTFFAIGTSKVSIIQMFGIGTALAILVDATLIRGVLVPAFMRLAGDANWWSPAPLRRLHRRIALSEPDAPIVPAPPMRPVPERL